MYGKHNLGADGNVPEYERWSRLELQQHVTDLEEDLRDVMGRFAPQHAHQITRVAALEWLAERFDAWEAADCGLLVISTAWDFEQNVAPLHKDSEILLVAGLGSDAVPQLLVESLVRARFAELLCPKIRLGHKKASAFLLGLLSHLDALLHRPIYLRFERNLTASSDAPLFRSVETSLLTTGGPVCLGPQNRF
jgi:hypothetical protein